MSEKKTKITQDAAPVQAPVTEKVVKTESAEMQTPQVSKPKEHSLKISNFTLAFGDNVLFENFDYEFKPGIYLFKGPSGVGKSTLMRVIAGLERRFKGKIELDGKELRGFTPDVHMMHQHYTSFPWLNLLDNTLMVYKGHKVKPNAADTAEAMAVLTRLGLEEHIKKRPSQISGGQDQRLSLASVFINRWSPVILYDEPTSALDQLNDELVVEMILERQAKYGTIEIVITHEDHVTEGLHGTVLDFTPEFRLRPPKVKESENVEVIADETVTADTANETPFSVEGEKIANPINTPNQDGVPESTDNVGDTM